METFNSVTNQAPSVRASDCLNSTDNVLRPDPDLDTQASLDLNAPASPDPNPPTSPESNASSSISFVNYDSEAFDYQVPTAAANNVTKIIEPVQNISQSPDFKSKLTHWALEENISHKALDKLLHILKEEPSLSSCLPLHARTLLRTPRQVNIQEISPGHYYHFGIQNNIIKLLSTINFKIDASTSIDISCHIDGLPLSKSSNSSFWPILFTIDSYKELENQVMIIGLYHGSKKPNNSNEYLLQFVNEAKHLIENGISFNRMHLPFKIKNIICDAPAKSYILNVKMHSGYSSCNKCTQEGHYIDRKVCFPDINFTKRTDESFRSKEDEDYHLNYTIIEQIPNFNIVENIPVDYMHSLCLGVMKRLLAHKKYGFIFGSPPYKLPWRKTDLLCQHLEKIRKYVPKELPRKPRSVLECRRYKATEFRHFILYLGPVVFKNILPQNMYQNFLLLHVAAYILSSEIYCKNNDLVNYAHQLLECFIKNSVSIYGNGLSV
ncbi:unnamed protein product [Ceutorhynchus assimilis]|uniref:Transposase domain-containing protein n=1 Tax=Ceutorhynchus assimilis TaxID=467358 RepID=A0A9N9QNU8_9CUCU|nr:unnamed protein product [Ceutorhynchus assimilis]